MRKLTATIIHNFIGATSRLGSQSGIWKTGCAHTHTHSFRVKAQNHRPETRNPPKRAKSRSSVGLAQGQLASLI